MTNFTKMVKDAMQEIHPIRRYREERGLTQAQLAELIEGATHVDVSRWENAQREPRGRKLRKLVEVTGIPMEEILRACSAAQAEVATQ